MDNTVVWKPGPIRALVAARPAAFRSLIDVERGFYGPKVGALWDGHVAVWLTTAKINKCPALWTITDRDTSLPDHQSGQSLPPGRFRTRARPTSSRATCGSGLWNAGSSITPRCQVDAVTVG